MHVRERESDRVVLYQSFHRSGKIHLSLVYSIKNKRLFVLLSPQGHPACLTVFAFIIRTLKSHSKTCFRILQFFENETQNIFENSMFAKSIIREAVSLATIVRGGTVVSLHSSFLISWVRFSTITCFIRRCRTVLAHTFCCSALKL